MPQLTLTLCGRVSVQVDDRPPTDAERRVGGKAMALLAYLAVEGGAHARPTLAALLWGEHDEAHARTSLRQALTQLRRTLGPVLRDDGGTVAIAAEVTCDVLPLLRGAVAADAAMRLDVHRFLTELPLRDAPAFDEWADGVRERLRGRAAGALAATATQALARRDAHGALAAAERWRLVAPLDDEPVLAAMRALAHAGRPAEALVLADAHRRRRHLAGVDAPGRALELAVERVAHQAGAPATAAGDDVVRPAAADAAHVEGAAAARAVARRLATAPLQEREREWAALASAWKATCAGAGAVLVVDGEPGAGKSRLLDDFARWVTDEGGAVLRAPSVEADRAIPFAVTARLVAAALASHGAGGTDGRWLAELARLEPQLHARFPGVPPIAAPSGADGWRLFEALAQLLATVAAESPVLVLLDDLPWCDAESVGLLHALADRLRGAPVLWCASTSPSAAERDAAGSRLVRALGAMAGALVVRPRRVGGHGVRAIVGALGDPAPTPGAEARASALVAQVLAESEGVPQHVVALLGALHAAGALTVRGRTWDVAELPAGRLPVRLAELPVARAPIVARLERLAEDARELLVTIAVAALPCDATVLSHVHTMSRLRVASLADALRARGLVVEERGAFRCAHRVVAEVVCAELGGVWHRETHRALAHALRLLHDGAPTPAVAAAIRHHARLAGEADLHADGVAAGPAPAAREALQYGEAR